MNGRDGRTLYGYVATITVAGLAILAANISDTFRPSALGAGEFWILGVGVIAGEFIRIRIPHRQETLTVTVGDPFTLTLLFAFGLGPAIAAKTLATILDDIYRRQVWWKSLFNIGQFSLSLGAGYLVIRGLGFSPNPQIPLDPPMIFATLLAAAVYFLVNMTTVTTAIAIAVGEHPLSAIKDNLKMRVINQGTLLGFTPVVAAALNESLMLFPLILIPILVVYNSGLMTQRHITLADRLKELYEATRLSHGASKTKSSVHELLERGCKMFDATSSSIVLFPQENDGRALVSSVDLESERSTFMEATTLDPMQGVWARVASEDKALLFGAPFESDRLGGYFAARGVKDAMVAPLRSDESVIGVIEVAHPVGAARTFVTEDLKLFETLANHASIALENARLISELEDSLVHLTEMNQLKDDFVASVSHELRTPLTSIQGYVKTLLRADAKFDAAQQRSFLETVDRQSNRLHRLIEDLLAVSRLESQTEATNRTRLSIADLTRDVVDELRDKTEGRTVTIDLDVMPTIETDQGKVHQILLNLLDNALKYTPMRAPIIVRGRADGDGVTISVIDHGDGIPPDAHDMIFDRFFQVDQSLTRAVGGTGLGLYICRRMAEAIGARVWLERSDENGSTFSVWLPRRIPDVVSSAVVGSKLGTLPA